MTDSEAMVNIRRAELARAHLAKDLGGVFRTGEELLHRGKAFLKKAVPVALAAGVLGVCLLAAFAARRRPRRFLRRERPSLLAGLLRRAAFSAMSVLASRAAKRLPLPRLSSAERPRELRRGDVDPMLPELRGEPAPRRARA